MALTIADLRVKTEVRPPRLCIYGPPGLGKTNLACEFPSPILLDVEGRRPTDVTKERVPGFDADQLGSYDEVIEALTSIYNEEHDFKTLVFDTVDRFEPLVWAKVCDENNVSSIEEVGGGFGKGYVAAVPLWRTFLDWCFALRRDRGMAIILIAHSEVTQAPSPTTGPYPMYDVRLNKRARDVILSEMDAIVFINRDASLQTEKISKNERRTTHALGGGTRWLYLDGRPAFTAKSMPGMPDKLIYEKGKGFSTLLPYLTGHAVAPPPAAEPETKPVHGRRKAVETANEKEAA